VTHVLVRRDSCVSAALLVCQCGVSRVSGCDVARRHDSLGERDVFIKDTCDVTRVLVAT